MIRAVWTVSIEAILEVERGKGKSTDRDEVKVVTLVSLSYHLVQRSSREMLHLNFPSDTSVKIPGVVGVYHIVA